MLARRPALVAYTAGHTHRHRVRRVDGVPSIEVGCVKDFPGTWAEYRVHDGGILQVVHRMSSPEALAWSESCRGLYADFGVDYAAYALGTPGGPLLRHRPALTFRIWIGRSERAIQMQKLEDPTMNEFDAAAAAVQAALDAGARYADARVMVRRYESMSARNGEVEQLTQSEDAGLGVRALVGSGWGFYATGDQSDAAARAAGAEAARIAAASALVGRDGIELVAGHGRHRLVGQRGRAPTRWPSPLADKGDLLVGATATMREHGADIAEGLYQVWDTAKWFVSSDGHRIDQHIRECGAGIMATAIGDGETQRRSYPAARGQYGTRGWELVDEIDLRGPRRPGRRGGPRRCSRAPACPSGETTLVLGSEQMALQIHESVGHAIELDRILGWEAAYAGTSWLDLAQLGSLQYGSELMNITIDPTIPGALGSFGFDDEGTPGRAA